MSDPSTSLRILVVDDDPAGCRMTARLLRGQGHDVLEATDCASARRAASERQGPLDVLVIDCVMPELLGHELAAAIAGGHPAVGVVLMSGSAGRQVGEVPSAARSTFLAKPFDAEELRAAVAAVAGGAAAEPDRSPVALPAGPAVASPRCAPRRGSTGSRPLAPHRLGEQDWALRQHIFAWILRAQVLLIAALAVVPGSHADRATVAGLVALQLLFAVVAGRRTLSRPARTLATALGLLVASEALAQALPGVIEVHAYFYVVIVLLSLYEDWAVFALAVAFAIFHQSLMGSDPWSWRAIQALFVGAVAIVNTLSWRLHERYVRIASESRESIVRQGLHDALTGVGNRRLLVEEITRRAGRATASPSTVIVVELDRFTLINDLHGPTAGDRLLVDVADRLRHLAQRGDVVARIGGDEFALVVDGDGGDGAPAAAGRVLQAMLVPFLVGGVRRRQSCSVGVARIDAADASADAVLLRAEAAVRRAKDRGRARVEVADEPLLQGARRRAEVEQALANAQRGEFRLVYQPIVDLRDGSVPAVESLLRWQHPTLGEVSPGEFVPIAEQTGRMVEIGRWVLEMACRQAAEWALHGRPGADQPRLFINIAAAQITDRSFASTLAETLELTGVSGRQIALELTETSFVEGMVPHATLASLQQAGVDLVLDDFGVGYSSLGYLARFPIATIKLDRSFLTAERIADSWVILDAVVSLARGLRLTTVAEGIETQAQLDEVRRRGFRWAQGYLFSRPVGAAELAALLAERRPYATLLDGTRGDRRLEGLAA